MRTPENTDYDKKAKRIDIMLPVITAAAVAVLAGGLFLINTMMDYSASFADANNFALTDSASSEEKTEIRRVNTAPVNENTSKNELSSEDQQLIDIADRLITEYKKPYSTDFGASEDSIELLSKDDNCFHVKHGHKNCLDSSDVCYSDFTISKDKYTGKWFIDSECTVVTEL